MAIAAVAAPVRWAISAAAWLRRHLTLSITVIVPTTLAILYYGLMASDVYVSESRFVVRTPSRNSEKGSLVGQLLQSTVLARADDDTYSVHDYILSRDALHELDEKLGLRKMFSGRGADFINRFPGIFLFDTFEELYRYYGYKVVDIEFDTNSSITTLTVRAFSARDAQRINDALLTMGERLINEMNERTLQDTVRFAEHDAQVATEKATNAAVALFDYRSKHAVFEPDKQAAIQLESVAKIQEELVATEAQVAQLQKISPANPQIGGLQSRAETLRRAIFSEAAKVTSASGSFSAHAPEFERLTVESMFADKLLGDTLADLEQARSTALRQQLYLERLVQPSLPDEALEPRRFRDVLTVLLIGMILWGVASLVVAAIREHAD
jgi:capsular polysaccharide transport system permease protein